ncbi:MAG TPA: glycosyltransferase family 1 protein [Solirubrobacteraceae bacterium]
MTRVLLDTTYARRAPRSGTAVYLERLQDALAGLDGVDAVPAANRRRRAPAGGGLGSVRNLLSDAWWTTLQLPRLARRANAGLIHHPLPARAPLTRTPQVITVHDLSFERLPEQFDPRYRAYARRAHRDAARHAAAVICVSETTAADVRELWQVPAGKIVVAPLGPGQRLGRHDPPDHPRHFLYLGDAEPRKNLGTLLTAYQQYRAASDQPLELVLAGSARAHGPGIRIESAPDAGRLSRLFAEAAALVHPSLYEGFGLTVLESMDSGTPVIAARSPGLVETCGNAAQFADPRSPDAFADAMSDVARDPALRIRLRERGIARAGEFSWSRCAHRHADAYSLALDG